MLARVTLVLLVQAFGAVHCKPDGTPEEGCGTMMPQHKEAKPQTSPNPYKLTATPEDGCIELLLKGKDRFKGFFVRAFTTAHEPAGEFKKVAGAKHVKCDPRAAKSAVTHENNEDKSEMKLTWTPPQDHKKGDSYHFFYTVVQNFSTFWANSTTEDVKLA